MAASRVNFSPRTVLITGASAGIGMAFAKLLAARGDRLILTARRADRLHALADSLKSEHNTESTIIPLDLGAPGGAEQLFAQTEAQGLTVDVLINNAGFGKYGPFGIHPLSDYQQMIALNMGALTDLCYLYLPGMRHRRRGGILNVSSLGAYTPVPYLSVYAATKAYVMAFTQAIAAEVSEDNVQITSLCPGSTTTEFSSVASDAAELVTHKPGFASLSAEAVAKIGWDGFEAGRVVIVTGLINKIAAVSIRAAPDAIMRRTTKAIFGNRRFMRSVNYSNKQVM